MVRKGRGERRCERYDCLGLLYDNGHGVAQDAAKAREWLKKAAAKDNANASGDFLEQLLIHGQTGPTLC